MWVMLMSPHKFDMALCDVPVKIVALSFSLVFYSCTRLNTVAVVEYSCYNFRNGKKYPIAACFLPYTFFSNSV